MDRLPLEIVQLICAFARDDCRESLCSLSLLNQSWYTATVPSLYETLTIKFTDHADLERIVIGVKQNQLRQQYLTHARRLDLICVPDIDMEYIDEEDGHIEPLTLRGSKDKSVTIADFLPDTVGPFLGRHLTHWRYPWLGHSSGLHRKPGLYEEKQWEPLVTLITSLERLTEFNYVLANMFPKRLLQAVHTCHPKCRLNIWGWQYLNQHKHGLEGLCVPKLPEFDDPFEMDVLSSPCLHAISLFYGSSYHRTNRMTPAPQEVECQEIFPLIAMAPNLKHVYLKSYACSAPRISESNKNWRRYVASLNPSYTATPTTLSFFNQGMGENVLPIWIKATDFSGLQSLDICNIHFPPEFKDALSGLRNLNRLSVDATPLLYPSQNFENELKLMFEELNPLKYLRIRGTRGISVFQSILPRHGKTLLGLIIEPMDWPDHFNDGEESHAIYPLLEPFHIAQFADLCPYVEELRLPIARSWGNRRECQLYEALGKFRSLRSLVLDLDCYSLYAWDTSSTDSIRDSKIYSALANAAMDETLARSIWDLISSNQQTRRLRHLRISIFGGNTLHWGVRRTILQLSRSFLITKAWHDPLEVKMIEIGQEEREVMPQLVPEYTWAGVSRLPMWLQGIIQSLWPSAVNSDRILNWRSFPLCAESNQGSPFRESAFVVL